MIKVQSDDSKNTIQVRLAADRSNQDTEVTKSVIFWGHLRVYYLRRTLHPVITHTFYFLRFVKIVFVFVFFFAVVVVLRFDS
ncbi:MAG: hypothetical protein ATN34_00570 [Epulopiscium sp. Nele67-Bin002]|nr:MAG: hypothetical protein ATN34_00570 [Epulopiscium sp. Nele67-Bin002]OON93428.1 MAG: hypothetical protein ATN33_05750 [Epulopiscium sp. Nele67-Bin001]